jgi:hypothetical protein
MANTGTTGAVGTPGAGADVVGMAGVGAAAGRVGGIVDGNGRGVKGAGAVGAGGRDG